MSFRYWIRGTFNNDDYECYLRKWYPNKDDDLIFFDIHWRFPNDEEREQEHRGLRGRAWFVEQGRLPAAEEGGGENGDGEPAVN